MELWHQMSEHHVALISDTLKV